jgi:hypothetical protein
MIQHAGGAYGWDAALLVVYALVLWCLAVAGIVVLAAQVGRSRGRGRPTRRPWI